METGIYVAGIDRTRGLLARKQENRRAFYFFERIRAHKTCATHIHHDTVISVVSGQLSESRAC